MEIGIDSEVFTQRKKSIADAAEVLRDLEVGPALQASGVIELASVDDALSQLHSGVKTVRDAVNSKLEDSNEALSGVQKEFQSVEAAQQIRVAKIMLGLQ